MDIGELIKIATIRVTKTWTRQREAEERDAKAELRRREALTRSARSHRVTLKDAVLVKMRDGIAAASGGGRFIFPGRNLYYSVRDSIQSQTQEELKQKYFDQIVKLWEKANGPVPGMYRDPRGYFIEPHTGEVVPLGSREVESYTIPLWLYDKILYVEKKGFHEIFRSARIAERYDLGIICAEGYATDAAKLLLARAEQSDMTILCLHDADPYGYNIARKVRAATRLQRTIKVIDMGMSLQDALDIGLSAETFVRKNALPQGLSLNTEEQEYFRGVPHGWHKRRQTYKCRRVELNALAADPDRFIAYVERKLQENGCARKLVPPKKVLHEKAKSLRTGMIEDRARQEIMNLLGVDEVVRDLAKSLVKRVAIKDLPRLLGKWAEKLEPESWEKHLRHQLGERVSSLTTELHELTSETIRERLGRVERADP
jgi:hypothetical protein